jgi:tetratricopeptide (TPR) repeat protein
VILAGSELAAPYGALLRASAALPEGAGWHPLDLMARFAAGPKHLAVLTRGAEPYRLSHPARPQRTARDLAAAPRPEALAPLVQYRRLGAERALAMVEFTDAASRAVATRGFQSGYAELTHVQLHAISRMDGAGAPALLDFLAGPYAQWGLFAPRGEPFAVRAAAALTAFGRYHTAAQLLQDALSADPEDVPALLALAGLYSGPLGRPDAAAAVAERILAIDPQHPAADQLRALASGRSL